MQDSGPGIPDNLQQQIFEPFVQGDLGLSKKYGGTGLGLSICSQLAELMRGGMSVRSAVGEGSTFTMKIPLRHISSRADSSASSCVDVSDEFARRSSNPDDPAGGDRTPARHSRNLADDTNTYLDIKPPSQNPSGTATPTRSTDPQPRLVGLSQPFFATSQPLESPGSQPAAMHHLASAATDPTLPATGRIRVLVAEDNKTNQEVVLRMLKLEEIYDVTVARDGQEALDLVRDGMRAGSPPFNLVLMDVQMPTMDGLQSTRLIRESGYRAPIVALTAFSEESNIRDCLDSGMDFFLSKPIRRPQLKKVLREYCAPILEEEEGGESPGETRRVSAGEGGGGGGGGNTFVVVVDRERGAEEANGKVVGAAAAAASASASAKGEEEGGGSGPGTGTEGGGERCVSPLTKG